MDSTLQLNMSKGVTPISHSMYDLHMTVFWICVGIAAVVFSVMIYALIRHRKAAGYTAAKFHENTWVEIAWAVIPFILLILIAVPATRVLIRMNDDSDPTLTVKIVGYQWKWKYEYLNQGVAYFSNLSTPADELQNVTPKNRWYLLQVDHPLVLPTHEKIRFLITSNDVIHSWWVPELGVKKDALPGFINEAWARIEKPGVYRGQCAELCGTNHGFMPIVVVAIPPEEFQQWIKLQQQQPEKAGQVAEKPLSKTELMAEGKIAFETNCAVCHRMNGSGMPPAIPALDGSKIVNGPLATNIDIVLYGRQGTAMQGVANILNNENIAAIITYIRNSWGNHTGDVVQPQQIQAARRPQTY